MKILILTAMEEELEPLLKNIKIKKSKFLNEVYEFNESKNKIYLSTTGIGKVNAAFSTTFLISELTPDLVVNMGTAGGVCEVLTILDVVIADKVAYHDVDVTGFGYEMGQVPKAKTYLDIKIDETLLKKITLALNNVYVGTIVSGDQFINDKSKTLEIEKNFINVYALEMESTAIVDVCQKLNTKVLIIRGISDLAHSDATIEFNDYLHKVAKKFDGVIQVLKEF